MPFVETDHDQDAALRRYLQQRCQGIQGNGAAFQVFAAVEGATGNQAFGKGDQARAFSRSLTCQFGNLF
ncbi:hypothetical protein D3C76_680290 [compost metagenome]